MQSKLKIIMEIINDVFEDATLKRVDIKDRLKYSPTHLIFTLYIYVDDTLAAMLPYSLKESDYVLLTQYIETLGAKLCEI